jgi:hypothetical protein
MAWWMYHLVIFLLFHLEMLNKTALFTCREHLLGGDLDYEDISNRKDETNN